MGSIHRDENATPHVAILAAILALASAHCASGDDTLSATPLDDGQVACPAGSPGCAARDAGPAAVATVVGDAGRAGRDGGGDGGARDGGAVDAPGPESTIGFGQPFIGALPGSKGPDATDGIATVRFTNNCRYKVDVASTTPHRGFGAYAPFASLEPNTWFDDDQGPDSHTYNGLAFVGRRDGTDPGTGNYTLAELTLNAPDGFDFYDVSLVDAFNIPMQIAASGVTCPKPTCAANLLVGCPLVGAISFAGVTVSCSKMGDRDAFDNVEAIFFGLLCPQAYNWSGDPTGTNSCKGQDYVVTFCP